MGSSAKKESFGMRKPLWPLLFVELRGSKERAPDLGFVSLNFFGLCFLTYKTGMIMHVPHLTQSLVKSEETRCLKGVITVEYQ